MSGIAGIYCLDDRPVDRQDLQKMVDVLAHRGPDGARVWVDGSIGFGHRMLWTTSESLVEKLPLVKNDLIITADARIDNRNELKLVLDLPDRPLEKVTDSEFILAAYEKWGEDCPKHLLGDFAFAIWDKRKQTLFCARDHMGIKPFYYYHRAGQIFTFASELKAVFSLSEVPHQINQKRVAEYLVASFDDKANTFYKDIYRLPPASSVIVTDKIVDIQNYWLPDANQELHLDSDEEYAELLRNVFTEAVRCRLRSAFPIGSQLSGGLDSSSVTCVARLLLAEESSYPLNTFSTLFEATSECDERSFIETVVAQGNVIPHYINGNQLGPLSNLRQIFQYQDEPVSVPNHFLVWQINEVVQQEGVRVLLSGFDGDCVLSHGDGYFSELAKTGQWEAFARAAVETHQVRGILPGVILRHYGFTYLEELARRGRWIAFIKESNQILQYFKASRRKIFRDHFFKPILPNFLLKMWRSLRSHNQSTGDEDQLINSEFLQRVGLSNRIESLSRSQLTQAFSEREQHWHQITSGLLSNGLETVDQYSAAFSIESRHPFMDKRLVELCLSLPPEQKLRHGWSRYVMRRAMFGILPPEIQHRAGKAVLSSGFVYGLLKHDREVLNEAVQLCLKNNTNYVNKNALYQAHKQLMSAHENKFLKEELNLLIWRISLFSLWLHQALLKLGK